MKIHISNTPVKNLRVAGMSEQYLDEGLEVSPEAAERDDSVMDVTASKNVSEGGVVDVDEQTGNALIENSDNFTEHRP